MNTIDSELSMNDLNNKFFEIMQNESNAEEAASFIYDSVFDDVALGFIFEFHHGLKTGLTDLIEGEKEDDENFKIVSSPECDVFGVSILKKTQDSNCSCPNCDRPVSATRFAPHLEKCMGEFVKENTTMCTILFDSNTLYIYKISYAVRFKRKTPNT